MPLITAKDGKQFDPDVLPMNIARNADGTVAYIEVKVDGQAYRQNFTYTGGQLIAISRWVKY